MKTESKIDGLVFETSKPHGWTPQDEP